MDVERFAPQSFSSLTAGLDSMKLRSTLWPSSSLILLTPYLCSVSILSKKFEARWNSLDHGRPLQAQAPPIHPHVFWQPHRLQHLRPEHTAVTNLNPLIQARMEPEDLQTWLCVRVIGWLEAQVVDAHLLEEDFHKANQAAKRESIIGDHALNLVEFSKMSLIDSLISKDPINGEVASWTRIKGELVKHVR
jgi:hypothetical protein